MAKTIATHNKYTQDVLDLIGRFSEFGATPEDGVQRLAASKEDKQARDYLCHWFKQNGFVTLVDKVGNIFGVLELDRSREETAFYCGSHLDSQPYGGRFDGALGVAFACVAALALKELIDRGATKTAYRNFVVACWTSEEGARFQPSLLGSRVFAGNMEVSDAWACKDADGITLKQALIDIGYLGSDTPPGADHYLEAHIEQGIELEKGAIPVGLVSAAWGARKLTLSCKGQADHTGPTPMRARKDALLAASNIVITVNDIAHAADGPLHSSVGRIEVLPNSPNTVASEAMLWIEFRAADENLLDEAEAKFKAARERIAESTGCTISVETREERAVIRFDKAAITRAEASLNRAGIAFLPMTTISGHDALQLQSICPSTLMFVPSRGGISHAPQEFTSDADIEMGFAATLGVVAALLASPNLIEAGEGGHV